jgi:hypothetical protein
MSGWLWAAARLHVEGIAPGRPLLSRLRRWFTAFARNPRLAPWAAFFRRFAAGVGSLQLRGLHHHFLRSI